MFIWEIRNGTNESQSNYSKVKKAWPKKKVSAEFIYINYISLHKF